MAKTPNTEVDQDALKDAKNLWVDFTALMKWSTISVAGILLLLLIFVY